MSLHFQQELDDLKEKLLRMAGLAESAVSRAVKALADRDSALARQVDEEDEVLDRYECEVDELSIKLLAKAPLAAHLRLITVAMKASHDLERVGDEACKIARRAKKLNDEPPLEIPIDIPHLASLALQLLKDAMDGFVNGDSGKALGVIPRDKEVDVLNKQISKLLVNTMVADQRTITRALHLMTIAKSLERIADHATNIAEEVVYLYEGRDVRHLHGV